MMTYRYPATFCFALTVTALLITGCDSGDANNETSCREVDGRYTIAAFEFDPNSSALPTFSLLDTLDVSRTDLTLTDQCEYVFTYKFKGQSTELVTNDFRVTESTVRLETSEADRSRLERLYLTGNIILDRLPGRVLESSTSTTVNLGDFSSEYENVTAEGNMLIRFTQP